MATPGDYSDFHESGVFKGTTTGSDVDRRHGDPDEGGLSSGQKAAVTRAVRAELKGDEPNELRFMKENPEKEKAAEEYMEKKRHELSKEQE